MILQYAVGGALMPFITLLLRERGMNVAEVSHILLAGSTILLVSPFFWGMLADKYVPLNRLFIWMNAFSVAGLLVFLLQDHFLGLLLSFLVFYACYQPAPMLVNALSYRHLPNPVEQFGSLRLWGSVGWILPSIPVFAWLWFRPRADFGFATATAILCSAAMMWVAWYLPHTPPGASQRSRRGQAPIPYGQAFRKLMKNRSYLVVLASYFLISASFCIQAFYSPAKLVDLGLNRAWIGPAQCFGVLVEILLFPWRSALVRRLNYGPTILLGCLTLTLRQLLFGFSNNLWLLCVSYALVGITVVLYHIGVSLLVEEIAGPEVKSTAQTLLVLCSAGLGPMFANWLAGLLGTAGPEGLDPVFHCGSVLAALACVLLLLRGSRLDRPLSISR